MRSWNVLWLTASNGKEVPVGVTTRIYSIHFAATAPLDLRDMTISGSDTICGLEALIAVGLRLNPKFRWVLER